VLLTHECQCFIYERLISN